MDDTSPQEAVEPAPQRDLRAELFKDISTKFSAALRSNGLLPVAAQEALIEILDSEAPTAAQIIAAAKIDLEEEEGSNE